MYGFVKLLTCSLLIATVESNIRRNLCSSNNCGTNSECIQVGDEAVCQCQPGFFSPSGAQRDCEDRNECLFYPCGTYSTCTNTIGSYTCTCLGGFISDTNDNVNCRPINTNMNCNFGHSCGTNSRCARHNTVSTSHRCFCFKGFYIANQRNCPDVNECQAIPNSGACPAKSRCINTMGTFECQCMEGFEKDMFERCVDIDECENRPCGSNSACFNNYGSYTCQCFTGYMSRGGRGNDCVEDPNAEEVAGGTTADWCYGAMVAAAVTVTLLAILILCVIFFIFQKRKRSKAKGNMTG